MSAMAYDIAVAPPIGELNMPTVEEAVYMAINVVVSMGRRLSETVPTFRRG
jgi:hypothetical protein